MKQDQPMVGRGIVPGAYQCAKCRHVFRRKLRGFLPAICPRCLSWKVMPTGCLVLPPKEKRDN